jgi:hypothetical protein
VLTLREPRTPEDFGYVYYNARVRLRQQRATLTLLFDAAKSANSRVMEVIVAMRSGKDVSLEQAVIDDGAVHAYSAGLVLYLDDVLKQLRWSFEHANVGGNLAALTKPFGGGTYDIGDVMCATANNVRHYDEWNRYRSKPASHREKSRQMPSIRVLAAVLDFPLPPDGVNHGFNDVFAWPILEKLARSYADLEAHIRQYAYEMVTNVEIEESRFVEQAAREESP